MNARNAAALHGRTSTLIEDGAEFFVRCDCGYETPTFEDEDAAWARHDKHVNENGGFPWE